VTEEDRLILRKLIEAIEGNIQAIPGRSGAGSPTPKPAGKRVYGKSIYDDEPSEENYDNRDTEVESDEPPVATSRAFKGDDSV